MLELPLAQLPVCIYVRYRTMYVLYECFQTCIERDWLYLCTVPQMPVTFAVPGMHHRGFLLRMLQTCMILSNDYDLLVWLSWRGQLTVYLRILVEEGLLSEISWERFHSKSYSERTVFPNRCWYSSHNLKSELLRKVWGSREAVYWWKL